MIRWWTVALAVVVILGCIGLVTAAFTHLLITVTNPENIGKFIGHIERSYRDTREQEE